MGIDYMIDHPCRPKQEMGEEHMINLLKMAQEKKPEKAVAKVESAQYLEVPVAGRGADRFDTAQLNYFISDCMSCPANAAADKTGVGLEAAFGCFLQFKYPVRTLTEKALLGAGVEAMQHPDTNPGSKLVAGVLRAHAKSKRTPAAQVRKMGREYYESKGVLGTKVRFGGETVVLDTNQMMTLLMVGPVPSQATGAFAILLERGLERARHEGITDPWSLAPMKNLAHHMRIASQIGRPVKITPA